LLLPELYQGSAQSRQGSIARFRFLGVLSAEMLVDPIGDFKRSLVRLHAYGRQLAVGGAPAQLALDEGCKDDILALGIAQQRVMHGGKVATAPSIMALRQGVIQSR
jgi:hypothetical protein